MQLDQEKFNAVKELTEIHANLSSARAEFLKLKEDTEVYMVVREQEAEERVIKVLKESREALEETSNNHKELMDFNRELQAYANEIKVLSTDIAALFKDFNARMKEAEKDLETNHKTVADVLVAAKVERVQITEDRKMLARERKKTEDGMRLLEDRRGVLDRAWAELKRLKNK